MAVLHKFNQNRKTLEFMQSILYTIVVRLRKSLTIKKVDWINQPNLFSYLQYTMKDENKILTNLLIILIVFLK